MKKSNSEKPNKMRNKNGEKAKYIYAKIMFSDLFHRT
jgi:hypothetical protein